jgi:SAM-dependent methyltransferase
MVNAIPPGRDAYGRELWAFLNGSGNPLEIVERDDGYVTAAPAISGYFAPFHRWPKRQREAIRHRRGDTALDVGCGAGRVALYLQERGFQVTAIDNSPLAIKTARKRGVQDARLLPFQRIDRLPNNEFGTVIMFGNNFGLFGSYSKAKRLLRELHRITAPEAVLLAESIDPYDTDDAAHFRYQRANRRRGRMSGQIRIRVRYRDCVGPWFDYLLASPREMKQIMDGSGWKVQRFIRGTGPAYVAIITRT